MKRRDFVLATAILAGAARAAAQQPERMRRIGVLQQGSESDPESQRRRAAFVDGLQEFGWTEGTNVLIDYRWVGADADRMRLYATELTSTRPDVICANSSLLLLFLMRATRSIPIVFTWVSDPVGSGFVSNLPHPGGNITGFHNFEPAIGGKWLAFLKQIAPDLRRVAVVHVPEIIPNVAFLHVVEAAAPSLGLSVTAAAVRNAADIERVLSAIGQEGGGLIVTPSALTATRRDLIITLAARLRLPAIYSFGFYAESGGLMSYGINQLELVRSAASYVDRILRGTSPGDLPVQLPLRYELVINLKTASALGLAVPNSLQLLADGVIE